MVFPTDIRMKNENLEKLLIKNHAKISADKKWAILLTPPEDIQKNRVKHPTVRVWLPDFLKHVNYLHLNRSGGFY